MGTSAYSSAAYSGAVDHLKATGASFARSASAARTGGYDDIADILDPKKLKNGVRESCFAAGYKDATPIIVAIDGTGSMQDVPRQIQQQLPKLIDLLIEQNVSDHPNVMFMCFDDEHYVKNAAFQMSQFEIGSDELVKALNEMIVPGQGGGNRGEGYHLAIYAAARHTKLECFERDQQKGFFFIIGDEEPYYDAQHPSKHGTSPAIAQEVFGDSIEREVTMLESLKELSEKYHVFVLRPGHTNHGQNKSIRQEWQALFTDAGLNPEHVLDVEETNAIISTIALAIGRLVGLEHDSLVDVLKTKGAEGVEAASKAALAIRPAEGAMIAAGSASGGLVPQEEETSGRPR